MLQYGGTTYRTLGYTGRVTNPSLILEGGGQTLYTPLFAVASGAEGRDGNYYYKCCPLAVQAGGTTYRAAYQRRYADSFTRTISGIISHSNVPVIVGKPSGTIVFSQKFSASFSMDRGGGSADTVDVTVMFDHPYDSTNKITFTSAPTFEEAHVDASLFYESNPSKIYSSNKEILYWGADKCIIRVTVKFDTGDYFNAGGSYSSISGTLYGILYVDVNGSISTETYPDETKSVTASGDFSYGHTYGSAPSLSADNGVSVSNNSGNASFHASKTLTGTVSHNNSKTLSQAFNVSFSGAA